jgi:hypothetical protein
MAVVTEGQFKPMGRNAFDIWQLNHGRLLGYGQGVQSAVLFPNC